MSMPHEQYRAICRAGFFLEKVMIAKKLNLKELSAEANRILRHFPCLQEIGWTFQEDTKQMEKERDRKRKENASRS